MQTSIHSSDQTPWGGQQAQEKIQASVVTRWSRHRLPGCSAVSQCFEAQAHGPWRSAVFPTLSSHILASLLSFTWLSTLRMTVSPLSSTSWKSHSSAPRLLLLKTQLEAGPSSARAFAPLCLLLSPYRTLLLLSLWCWHVPASLSAPRAVQLVVLCNT